MKTKTFLLLLLLISFVTGCQENTSTLDNIEKETKTQKINSLENREVKEIKLKDPPRDTAFPSDAVIHQFEVVVDERTPTIDDAVFLNLVVRYWPEYTQ